MVRVYKNETALLKNLYRILKSKQYFTRYKLAMKSDPRLTRFIGEIIEVLARKLKMNKHSEYYTLDHVLYRNMDVIPEGDLPFGTSIVQGTWLKHIRVAFEHENRLDSAGGFQEIAKLLLINADIKVLMGYAYKGENYDAYAREYQKIFSSVAVPTTPILFIGEYLDGHAEAYLITIEGPLKYDWNQSIWGTFT